MLSAGKRVSCRPVSLLLCSLSFCQNAYLCHFRSKDSEQPLKSLLSLAG